MSTPQVFVQPRPRPRPSPEEETEGQTPFPFTGDENDPEETLTPAPPAQTQTPPAPKEQVQWPPSSNEVRFARLVQGFVSHKNEDYILPPPPSTETPRPGQGPRLRFFAPRVESAVLSELGRLERTEDDFYELLEDSQVRTVLARLVARIIMIDNNVSGRFAVLQQNAGILMTLATADRRELEILLRTQRSGQAPSVTFRDLM